MSFVNLRAVFRDRGAHTHPKNPDSRLRGRTYAIPFAKVWSSIVEMAGSDFRRWTTLLADEDVGILRAENRLPILESSDLIEIRISLDENAQTRVDMSSTSREDKGIPGGNARRIRRFFRILDKRVGAGPGKIIDPTLPLIRTTLLLLPFLAISCGPGEEPSPDAEPAVVDSSALVRNFQARSYERHIVFVTVQGDSTLLVPWSFTARTQPEGVDREVRGWLARSSTWDPFLQDFWEGPPNSAPRRILPQGPVRLVVGMEDALETIIFQEGGRNLEVNLGELLIEWSGQRAQTYRFHRGTIILSERTVEGHLLDMSRAWAEGDSPPGDWGLLLSGDTLQVVMEDLAPESGPEGGSFALWARIGFVDRQWQEVRFAWSEVRAFEPARRDVPMSWEVYSPEEDLSGSLTAMAPFLEVGEGDGPMLPVDALFQVAGTLTLGGDEYPVQGFIRHRQR